MFVVWCCSKPDHPISTAVVLECRYWPFTFVTSMYSNLWIRPSDQVLQSWKDCQPCRVFCSQFLTASGSWPPGPQSSQGSFFLSVSEDAGRPHILMPSTSSSTSLSLFPSSSFARPVFSLSLVRILLTRNNFVLSEVFFLQKYPNQN